MDANFPLHALAALDLSSGGSPFINLHLEWPIGAPIRYLAWPLLLVAAPLNWLLDPIQAMNLGIVLWLSFQGFGIYWLLQKMSIPSFNSYIGASLALLAPQTLISLGNGQFENVAPFPLLLCFWTASKNHGWLTFLALLACCFSSPYIGILGLLITWFAGRKSPKIYWIIGLTLLTTYTYYGAVSNLRVHEATIPAPSMISERASLIGLFNPANIAENGGILLAGPIQRIKMLFDTPLGYIYDNRWPWLMATASSYVGILWLVAGFWGLWASRKKTLVKTLSGWAVVCFILSLGMSQQILSIELPMPWKLSQYSQALSQMQATARFLAAPSLFLAIGITMIPNRKAMLGLAICCAMEGLLFTPAHWPLLSRTPIKSEIVGSIDQPIIFWPAAPIIASHKVTMTALLIEQPLALFSDENASMPDALGKTQALTGKNRHRQSIEEWRSLVEISGATQLIQFRDITGSQGQTMIRERGNCDDSFCKWTLAK